MRPRGITAQLIHAADGFHLWSETHDRKLDDIFRQGFARAREVVEEALAIKEAVVHRDPVNVIGLYNLENGHRCRQELLLPAPAAVLPQDRQRAGSARED